ncbi:cytochrome c oxidase assembly protein subunit 15 [Aliiruegeria haliotis]|uniref:Heme A synthase n=1 Tax=Aliiruegeria haliotis TaxID=1280846 RepID=A0A2T0RT70_9RHOB|nr:heme A synthase [Aliiruegeria haliotis]PRY24327.1 cytochrome c oxidase assembly protein subunit 15 [Aliiruegeria haliotis]
MAAKRSIFEEVSEETPQERQPQAVQPGLIDRASSGARGAIRAWLMVLFAMVVAMIVVGGLTRLTDSGLSITEWAPVTGAIPPMTEESWTAEFEKYQQIPEYQLQNVGMTIEEFKTIYWWEWGHRQLGRVIGLVWAVGLGAFLLLGKVPTGWTGRLVLPGALGGVQGAVGWWMVSSGLQGEMLDVASYRLAIHLGLAFVILGLLTWYICLLGRPERDLMQARRAKEGGLFGLSTGLLHLTFLQILLGALVAGIDAGRAFPTWPLMGSSFFPPDPFTIMPVWRNFFEDAGLVQFMHRIVGYLVFALAVFTWIRARRSTHPRTRRAFDWMLVFTFGQVVIGIAAVLTQAQWHVAITHQLTAVLLWALILRARFLSGYPITSSVREGL